MVQLSGKDKEISALAAKEIRKKKKEIAETFANPLFYGPDPNPVTIFMAGSPGAGKTEFSRILLDQLKVGQKGGVVRIDPDTIRDLISYYDKTNAHLFQLAVSIGVDDLFNFTLKHNQNCILDGTFSDLDSSRRNIIKCIEQGRYIEITYLFQDPVRAWEFTQAREKREGRSITREDFIRTFLQAKETVDAVKKEFNDKVALNLIIKDYTNVKAIKTFLNIQQLDNGLHWFYNQNTLEKLIPLSNTI